MFNSSLRYYLKAPVHLKTDSGDSWSRPPVKKLRNGWHGKAHSFAYINVSVCICVYIRKTQRYKHDEDGDIEDDDDKSWFYNRPCELARELCTYGTKLISGNSNSFVHPFSQQAVLPFSLSSYRDYVSFPVFYRLQTFRYALGTKQISSTSKHNERIIVCFSLFHFDQIFF